MDLLKILEIFAPLSFFGTVLWWLISPRFRLKLKKKKFEDDVKELDSFLEIRDNFLNKKNIKPIQMQYAMDHFLGTTKYHYGLFIDRIDDMWNFKQNFSDLKYSSFFINQEIKESGEIYFQYSFKKKTLKIIYRSSIFIVTLAAVLYLILVSTEMIFSQRYSNFFSSELSLEFKINFWLSYIFILTLAIIFGSKATIALGLQKVFDIREINK